MPKNECFCSATRYVFYRASEQDAEVTGFLKGSCNGPTPRRRSRSRHRGTPFSSPLHKFPVLKYLSPKDAYIFASLLTDTSTTPRIPSAQDIKRLADTYNTVRVPRAVAMAKASVTQGDIYVLEVPGYEQYKEGDNIPKELLVDLFRRAEGNWLWTTADPEDDRRSALSLGEQCRAML